jgi:hypothetical protein
MQGNLLNLSPKRPRVKFLGDLFQKRVEVSQRQPIFGRKDTPARFDFFSPAELNFD